MSSKRRYVVVGIGHRVQMYLDAMVGDHRDDAELVGLIEPNAGRLAVHLGWLAEAGLDVSSIATGNPEDLERIVEQTGAERVIITSPDYTHADFIVRATAGRRRRGGREAVDHRSGGHPTDRRRRSSRPAGRWW